MNEVVATRQGEVQGRLSDGVYAYKGITYAAAPFGAFRFLAPQPVAPWSGVRNAIDEGQKPPQVPYLPPFDMIFPEIGVSGEDGLKLNV